MATDEYQGWTNRPTWCVALWLDNESEELYNAARARAKDEPSAVAAGEALRLLVADYVDQSGSLISSGFVGDMYNAALAVVDWKAIGEHFRTD